MSEQYIDLWFDAPIICIADEKKKLVQEQRELILRYTPKEYLDVVRDAVDTIITNK